jgi:hypothetical protein
VKINVLLCCPSGFLTVTAAVVPAVFAGATAVIEVLLVGLTIEACWFPTNTVAPDWKLVPVIVICVPPETLPEGGVRALMDGARTKV